MFDVIVIGSGISGLNFALRAAEKYKKVLVVTKKKIAESNTNFAQGGIAAVLSQLDEAKKHIQDTLVAGAFHNDKKAVTYMVKQGPASIVRLIELGVPFATQDGELLLTREGGHSERRIAFVSDYTGQAIEKALVKKVRSSPNITILEHAFGVDLLVKNKICYGVRVIHKKKCTDIQAGMVVLATGGVGQVFGHTTNPAIATGDGIGMAVRAGCRFRDMEFVQFHPTALKIKGKEPFLISEAVRGEGAYIVHKDGKRFMKKYHHLAELAPRDIVSRAIFEEEKKAPVYLDIRHKTRTYLKTRFPKIYEKLASYGLDMAKDLIPISPAAHYMCGGIRVNVRGETGVKNLYAFGEVAGTGVHGANRLASNSLLEALVFSDRIITQRITKQSKVPPFGTTPRLTALKAQDEKKISKLKQTLQESMWKNVSIVRSKQSLKSALQEISSVEKEASKIAKTNEKSFELINMIETAKLITKAALKRKKSLGCHYRTN